METCAVCACISSLVLTVLLVSGCGGPQPRPYAGTTPTKPMRDINLVLADHDEELMAIPGVVGVYVGLAPDGRSPCLHVMLNNDSPELRRRLPRELEGYPVRVEVTGPIRPLASPAQAQ